MAIRRILLVVEGEKDEKTILGEILTLYGFVKEEKEKDVLIWGQDNECDTFIFKKDKMDCVINNRQKMILFMKRIPFNLHLQKVS